TKIRKGAIGEGRMFSSYEEMLVAFNNKKLDLHAKIKVRHNGEIIETSTGRMIFNSFAPVELGLVNELLTKNRLRQIIGLCFRRAGIAKTVKFLDRMKSVGFEYATAGGLSVSIEDVVVPELKTDIINNAESKIDKIEFAYMNGVISSGERYNKIIDTWSTATNRVADKLYNEMSNHNDGFNSFWMMLDSKARGSKEQ